MEGDFVPHSHTPYKCGGGDYSDCARITYNVMDLAKPMVYSALEHINFDPASKKAFTITDYGTADGGMSMSLISYIIGNIKERYGMEQEIQVLYEDQATADFNALFRRLHGLRESQTLSYMKQYRNVFVSACGTNFYSQCFAKESVHLGFCGTASHWLSHRPCILKSSLQHLFSKDEVEVRRFAEVAEQDYELFLVNRAKELVPGGYLVMANITYYGTFAEKMSKKKQTYPMFEKYWVDMLQEEVITRREFEDTTFNAYYRTEEEFVAPFENHESAVYKSGLRLQSMRTILIPCPHNLEWSNSSEKDDEGARREYAKSFILRQRVWSNCSFMSGLSSERPEEERCRIVDDFFSRYENDIVKAPEEHGQDFLETFLIIKKEI